MDKTGELAAVVLAARVITRDEVGERYDGYLNEFYRSLTAWRRGNDLGVKVLLVVLPSATSRSA